MMNVFEKKKLKGLKLHKNETQQKQLCETQ